MEQSMIVPDDVRAALSVAGWDYADQMDELHTESSGFELPRVRIDHRENGKHRLYIDTGESYLETDTQEVDIPGNKLTGVVFAEQSIRALWQEGAEVPLCSAIDNQPLGLEPLASDCKQCQHGLIGNACKPKARLFMLVDQGGEVKPLVFALSPTSISRWAAHKKKLARSNLPVVAMSTTFELEDTKKGTYRWAKVKIGIEGIASKEMLVLAKQARIEFEEVTKLISSQDFSDQGDVSTEPF